MIDDKCFEIRLALAKEKKLREEAEEFDAAQVSEQPPFALTPLTACVHVKTSEHITRLSNAAADEAQVQAEAGGALVERLQLEMRRQKELMREAVLRMQKRLLGMGWNTWWELYLDTCAARDRLNGAIFRMQHRCVGAGFNKWRAVAEEEREFRLLSMERKKKALWNWLYRWVGSAFRTWKKNALDQLGVFN